MQFKFCQTINKNIGVRSKDPDDTVLDESFDLDESPKS